MSIISEALKQAKNHKREKVSVLAESDVNGTSGEMKEGTGFQISSSLAAIRLPALENWEVFVTWAVIILSCIVLISLFRWPAASRDFLSDMNPLRSVTHPQSAQGAAVKVPKAPYQLTGITNLLDGGWFAIVNNSIVKVNDMVDGAVVDSINENEVLLSTQKGKLTLKLS
ncbi:MAG: hypothetical protein A3G33_00300 [Omnitrophica bacterium RIFCSPLOWO2_12_FULL_44_17]|uniref:Uncharacterized protein n=1 Tax=Candidatus Danuiimicrobium aquiferis TaxID=1801832 RepID=A0A1G1KU76_9BACT|nr:MAG: hypothetical protein A3B72_01320 [Omnitrophica bacterium RIFCSPHIGHO2_02_FULL_45_28]OGW92632.1 MAG: hypothetical protein A3E74_05450 [Omnitrophica bacterium RIFCSPHIGHO2_12_FULL_44_12]OGW96405.1 MAG: hypothetical protein A3G33_00300 [Omnitrophica bacterium RIFCSPLOWO2_12_FULL_44_17]OGX02144.1 MAG: hypothetical protein A3J12_03575 [Omnitrophica bacterium RIFCSPLOWO2_02_FULL_44_11]